MDIVHSPGIKYTVHTCRSRNTCTEGGQANMQTNACYDARALTESGDPVYSVIDDHQYSQPPQLPPSSRVPYYQEIERDEVGIEVADYEEPPIKQYKQGKRALINN